MADTTPVVTTPVDTKVYKPPTQLLPCGCPVGMTGYCTKYGHEDKAKIVRMENAAKGMQSLFICGFRG